jgi:tetratricopeptide (TPR) repeat protein
VAENKRLAALMAEAGFLSENGDVGRKVFARAVTREAGARGVQRTYTHTYVGRWLSGVVPRDVETKQAIAAAIGRRIGRTVSLDEIGFPGRVSAELGLAYPATSTDGVDSLSRLLEADSDDDLAIAAAPVNIDAWNSASLSWLVGSTPRSNNGGSPSKVGRADVERIRGTRALFDRMDNQFGGAHARRSLIEYLNGELPQILKLTAADDVRNDLYSAAAEITQLAAWMSYDAGSHGLAQRYFIQALGLADMAGDRLLAASILDAMSHQATFLGKFREAANLARAARTGIASLGIPIMTAHFHVMEARALARARDAAACDRALTAAVTEFERHKPGHGPDWIQYFDEAELAAELGHCNRDLGRAAHATSYAAQSLGAASGDYLRSDFFATMVLADSHMDQGEVEQACDVALRALQIGENLKSARCASYVAEFRQRLTRATGSAVVREFEEAAESARLWTPTDRSAQ